MAKCECNSGVKDHRTAISFFHGIAMATLSMRDILIINISLPLIELETLYRWENNGGIGLLVVFMWPNLFVFWILWLWPLTADVLSTYLAKLCSNTWTNIHTGPNPALAQAWFCKCRKDSSHSLSLHVLYIYTKNIILSYRYENNLLSLCWC